MNLFCLRSCDKASGPQEEKAGLGHPGHSKPVGSGDVRSQRESGGEEIEIFFETSHVIEG